MPEVKGPVITEHHLTVKRTARYCTLGDAAAPASDVWVVCHGFAQLARRFVEEFRPIARPGRLIVAPEALNRFYLNRDGGRAGASARVGATWMTREARESDIADYIAYLDQLCRVLLPNTDLPLTVLGFSQGTATAARWAAATDRSIEHLILWGAGLPPDLDWQRAARRFASMRLSIVAGSTDEFWNQERVRAEQQTLQRYQLAAQTVNYEGGHHLDQVALDRLIAR
jgi:predicted esterase